MKPIFPPAIDGDLLKLVHLSNGFRLFEHAPALKVGDLVETVSHIESITNSDTGKTVSVRGVIYLLSSADDKDKQVATGERVPVVEISSSFFYRGKFTDFAQTFSRIAHPTYSVPISTPQAQAVLQAKEWFQWEDDSKPLQPGTTLQFKLESMYTYHDKSSYTMMTTTGGAYIITPELKLAVKVATVEYTSEGEGVVIGDACIEYLKRHGAALNQPNMLENGGYTLTKSGQCTFMTPASNLDYSLTSGDTNPIHTNPYFASLASLPGTITHGMHTSARTRKYVEQVVADNIGSRVRKYEVSFTAMCLPSHKMEVRLKHIGMTATGERLIKVETVDLTSGSIVLTGTAEVAQAPTAYVFTGQGSQEPGMGMELYNSSPVARAVWDEADRHLGEVYGFSILEIVRNNPKEKTVHFGGLKGQATRQKYMDMTYTSADDEGHVRTLPLFGDIDLRTSRYTFTSPTGLLYATQFAQIALVVTEKAAFEDMRAKGLFQKDCMFAGHSLGEYSALASIADILPISALVDVVFYRGITMQRAVERDHLNRSSYGMVAANPSRIGKSFGDAALREVVETISRRGNILIEVVNYNVEGQQYVVAGHLVALQSLTCVVPRLFAPRPYPLTPPSALSAQQRPQLPQGAEDRPRQAHRDDVDRAGQGAPLRDRRRVRPEGARPPGQDRFHHARARLCDDPAPRNRRAVPLALPVGRCHAVPYLPLEEGQPGALQRRPPRRSLHPELDRRPIRGQQGVRRAHPHSDIVAAPEQDPRRVGRGAVGRPREPQQARIRDPHRAPRLPVRVAGPLDRDSGYPFQGLQV